MDPGFLGEALAPLLGVALFLISAALGIAGLGLIFKQRSWRRLAGAVPIALSGPAVLYGLTVARSMPDGQRRDWYLITGVAFVFAWFGLWGHGVHAMAVAEPISKRQAAVQWTKRRNRGVLLIVLGTLAWLAGAFGDPSRGEGAALLLVWGYGWFVGGQWVLSSE